MNDRDPFESELRRIRPAEPSAEFMSRLRASEPRRRAYPDSESLLVSPPAFWTQLVRLLLPATALVALALLVAGVGFPGRRSAQRSATKGVASTQALKADDVRIDRELVDSFDAVAELPSGEPVRFRCREWLDQVVWRDRQRGITVEQRVPRIEVIPVRFETY